MIFPTRAENRISIDNLRQLLEYNPITGELTWLCRPDAKPEWNTRYSGKIAGTLTKNGGIQVRITLDGEFNLYHAHRIAWALIKGSWPNHRVDHEDCDPSNNAWLNLRAATCSQNNANRSSVAGAVPYRGVYFMRFKNKYAAQIKKDGKWHWLGSHLRAEDAARAYDAAAISLFGMFAKTNASLGLLK